ncbi:MAG: hypothetical protein JNM31_00575 [Flavobacteriales bacterium]|nr:hypothetical protein [Flavobacteriales bacterium]
MRPGSPATDRLLTAATIGLIVLAVLLLFTLPGCKHEPLFPPVDDNGGNGGGGGTDPDPCDPNTVYFQQQVLPLLISNCAIPGCHNTATDDNDWIEITSFTSLMNSGIVSPGNPWDSDMIEVVMETDPDKVMPRPPMPPLSPAQIQLLITWIQQGAQNNSCVSGCDTTNVTYSASIVPLVNAKCKGCHSGSTPQASLDLTQWSVMNTIALNGRLAGAVQHQAPYAAMPPSGGMLPQCDIDKFLIWIQDGAPNN